jgi:peptide-methionine (S)-S-oxide reductase
MGDFMPGRRKGGARREGAAGEETRGLTQNSNPLAEGSPTTSSNSGPTVVAGTKSKTEDRALSGKKQDGAKEISNRCAFGAGCYWGTERYLRHNFATKTRVPGRIEYGQVGFLGPKDSPKNPSYQDVCTGTTGYVEVYFLEFQGGEEYYEAMVRFFFQFHDPTTANKQGNDAGTQYASVIYCYDKIQFEIATKVKDELQHLLLNKCIPEKCYKESAVTTDIRMVDSEFVPAHEAHQDYLMKNPRGYCNHRMYLKEWPKMEGSQNNEPAP